MTLASAGMYRSMASRSNTMNPPLMAPVLVCGFSSNARTSPPTFIRSSPNLPGGRTAVTVASLPWSRWNCRRVATSTSPTQSP